MQASPHLSQHLRRLVTGDGLANVVHRAAAPLGLDAAALSVPEIDRVIRTANGYAIHAAIDADQIIVRVVDNPTKAARDIAGRLRKHGRRQLRRQDPAPVADATASAVVQRAGLDERILGLGALRRPRLISSRYGLGDPDGRWIAQLLAHCLGKRAVMRVSCEGHSYVAKMFKARSEVPLRVARLSDHLALKSSAFAVPTAVCLDPRRKIVVMEDLGATGGTEATQLRPSEAPLWADVLRDLHAIGPPPTVVHGIDAEMDGLHGAVSLAATIQPAAGAYLRRRAKAAAGRIRSMAPPSLVLVHRDLHAGQLKVGSQPTLMDFDTAARGDAMLDLGTLAARARLYGDAAFATRLTETYGPSAEQHERLRGWTALAMIRMASIDIARGRPFDMLIAAIEASLPCP